ncbi:hypothetical protein DWB85_07670 [Seongchinamella sediminis]|uniref:Glycine zipper 2TM domain-containing protein n=1 Tax=Seongchinamella sediminis TaxID=2283635 RepID=A0A3L7DY13_9GAMM|nr:glycine zipper 2TM domain-containing protein [Seongchinamella sediminis]RLQ22487.1 hypothetical protein DWB85_07670 [Seongchinamella sediminis]
MTRNYIIAVGIALLLPGIAQAHAGGHRDYEKRIEQHERKAEKHYRKARHHAARARAKARQARWESVRASRYGQVLSVQPLYQQGRGHSHSCRHWNEDYNPRHGAWVPTVVGGVIGSAIGYHIGEDHGDPEVATVAGGLLGAAAGHTLGRHAYDARHIRVSAACRPVAKGRYRARPLEYLVTYRYNGRIYRQHMDYDPGEWVKLNVGASPG